MVLDQQIRLYKPKSNGKNPAVVGFPGFATAHDEFGRIDLVLEELSMRGIAGFKIAHSTVRREDKSIVAPFRLDEYVAEYADAIEYVSERDDVDPKRIGVIASSMSAAIVAPSAAIRTLWRLAVFRRTYNVLSRLASMGSQAR